MSKNIKKNSKVYGKNYSFGSNSKSGLKLQILGKNPQIYLIIMREWPNNTPAPNIRNIEYFHFLSIKNSIGIIMGVAMRNLCQQ